MSEYDWEVFDMAHGHRYCLNEYHPAEFGPMSEQQARAMEARNPSGYWARKIPTRTPPPRPTMPDAGRRLRVTLEVHLDLVAVPEDTTPRQISEAVRIVLLNRGRGYLPRGVEENERPIVSIASWYVSTDDGRFTGSIS